MIKFKPRESTIAGFEFSFEFTTHNAYLNEMEFDEVFLWCKDQFGAHGKDRRWLYSVNGRYIWFRDHADAVFFRLRFG